ncbi:hypothetical protein ACWF82_00465 [Nocardia sp. NPDC055053]
MDSIQPTATHSTAVHAQITRARSGSGWIPATIAIAPSAKTPKNGPSGRNPSRSVIGEATAAKAATAATSTAGEACRRASRMPAPTAPTSITAASL